MRLSKVGRLVVVAVLAAGLVACGGKKKHPYVERSVNELYAGAEYYLGQKRYKAAGEAFDEVERQHPYSSWARQAQLMSAYSYYMANKYDNAILAAERFTSLHPGHRDAAYAYYLIAMCHYEQIVDVQRDQKETQLALAALQTVVDRFPGSDYARDAQIKMDLTRDHIAGGEMAVGRYYQKQGYYFGAINRFRTVVDQYQTTSQVPEALERLVECYTALGMTAEAQKAAAVLGYNYRNSDWYKDAWRQFGHRAAASGSDKIAPPGEAVEPASKKKKFLGIF